MTNDAAGATRTDDGKASPWKLVNGVWSKAVVALNHCTVEPMMAFFIVASMLTLTATSNLNMQKTCRVNLRLDDATCRALETREPVNGSREAEIRVQETMAAVSVWKFVLQNIVPTTMIVFIGSWSDRKRVRRPCMLMPFVGRFLTCVGLLACTYFFDELPMEVSMLVEAVPEALSGSWMVLFMAVYSYVGDVSTIKMRTFRIGIVNAFSSASVPIGNALSGIVYTNLGFYGVYSIAMAMYAMGFLYGSFYIVETRPETTGFEKSKEQTPVTRSSSCLDFFRDLFSLEHIREGVRVTFKKGQRNRRLRVCLLVVVYVAVSGPFYGEMGVTYLFTRVRFNWDETNFSWFYTFQTIATVTGTTFTVGVLNHWLQIDDAMIGFIGCVSNVLAAFVYAFATTSFVFYLAPIVDILNGTGFIAARSILSKLSLPDEQGKINSMFGICECMVPLVYMPMYMSVYNVTMDTMPGLFYLLGGAITVIAALIFTWFYFEHKKDNMEKVAIRTEEAKTDAEQEKNRVDDVMTVSDKETQTRQESNGFQSLGFDNKTFKMEEEFSTKL